MISSSASIAMELFIGPKKHQPFDSDGTIPSNHLHNFEHSSISMSFLVYTVFAIVLDRAKSRSTVSQGLTILSAAYAFAQQLFLFHLHSADHMGIEGQYHKLLQLVIFVSLFTTCATTPPMSASSIFNLPLIRLRSLALSSSRFALLPLSSNRFVSVPNSSRKLPNFRAFSNTAMTDSKDAGMDAVQRRLMFEDECILVDETDRVVGHDSKYNCHLMENIEAKNLLHRAFSVFLFNSNYELLLQQRSKAKVTFPLVWTNTCCSHPLYRESELIEENALGVRNAAQRKLLDELGIVAADVPVDEFTALGRMLYKAPSDGKWGEHELDYLLFIVRDVKVQPNPDEVADIKYVSREELKELVKKADAGEEGLKLSPWFRLVVDNFLMKWWDHVEKGTLVEAIDMKTIHKL